MRHAAIESWSRRDSALHRLHPVCKLLVLICMLVAVATTPDSAWPRFALYGACVAFGLSTSHLPVLPFLRRSALILPFALSFAVIAAFGGSWPRAEGLLIKSYLSGTAALLLIGSTPLPQVAAALRKLGLPQSLVLMVQFLYRYIALLGREAAAMRIASQCRAGDRPHRRSLFQAASGTLAVLFARSYQRANSIHAAMLSRGFTGQFNASRPIPASGRDRWVFFTTVLFIAAIRLEPLG